MRNIFKYAILLLINVVVQGQNQDIILKDTIFTGNVTITSGKSITLKPDTWIKTGSNFAAKISSDIYIPFTLGYENYVFTRIFQVPLDSSSQIVNNSDVIEKITYFDGLGRPMQDIAIKASPLKNDIVTPIDYDNFGRKEKEYMPYPESDGLVASYRDGSAAILRTNDFYKLNYPNDISANSPNPFSQSKFENSPLSRVLMKSAPGLDWAIGSGHEIKLDYQTNAELEVKNFIVTTFLQNSIYNTTLSNFTSYEAGQLYKTITYDENNTNLNDETKGATIEFKNKNGQVVLKRTYNQGIKHDTYYIYDNFGNLTYVIPPLVDIDKLIPVNVTTGYDNFSKTFDQSVFTGTTSGSGSVVVSIVNNVLKVQFGAGFAMSSLNTNPQQLLTSPCLLPDLNLGNIFGNDYSASIVNGNLKINSLTGNKVPSFSGTFTVNLPSSCRSISAVADQLLLDNLCYQYKYDSQNRLVEKKLPGKGWEAIVYDKLDRVVLTQDANLKTKGKWLFTKYDVFNRPVYTGEFVSAASRDALQTQVSAGTTLSEKRQALTTIGDSSVYYTNLVFPTTTINLFTVNYYDDYGFDLAGGGAETVGGVTPMTNAKGLATGSKVRTLGTTHWTTNVQYYDAKGRQIYGYSKNDFLSTVDKIKSTLDFTGKATQIETRHKKGTNAELVVVDSFEYDHVGRLLTQKQAINGTTQEIIASNSYDSLGQLVSKGVGGKTTQNRLQNVDYKYNIRGWLKGINDTNAIGNDLFSFVINYNTPTDPSKALYNGNISQTLWKTATVNTTGNPVSNNYTYTYDGLNRLVSGVDNTTNYNESLSYDKNGNILNILRKGNLDGNATSFGTMDNLVFSYDIGNKLIKVEDSGSIEGFNNGKSGSGTDFTYDGNGNMLRDNNKLITTDIIYNHLNLPTKIKFNGAAAMSGRTWDADILYTYDATGKKLSKKVTKTEYLLVKGEYKFVTTLDVTTLYAGGFQYENNLLQFFPTAEGYVEHNSGNYSYVYQYKDHLGNVRLAYKDSNNDGAVTTTEILSEDNYYPFGLKHKGYNSNVVNSNNKYKYNCKELQDELGLNMYDYGARNYDPAIGRWMNMDALAEVYVGISPYAYTLNNPVLFIDPDGNYVDDSYIYQKYTTGKHKGEYKNPSMVKAWEIFAKSKTGSAFLANFAQKGQIIAGEKFKGVSGKYDKANIDLNFGPKPNDGRSSATTDKELKGNHLQITIGIEDNPNLASDLGDFIDDIAHEGFGHADLLAEDFYLDKKIDYSNIDKNVIDNTDAWIKVNPRERKRYRENLLHHDHEIQNEIFIKKTFPILKEYYKNAKIKKTDAQIKYDVSIYPRL